MSFSVHELQLCRSKFCHTPMFVQFLVTDNTGLFGQVKIAVELTDVLGQVYTTVSVVMFSASQNWTTACKLNGELYCLAKNFHGRKNFAKPSYLCIAEVFVEFIFANASAICNH